jgi:hypothetical protein
MYVKGWPLEEAAGDGGAAAGGAAAGAAAGASGAAAGADKGGDKGGAAKSEPSLLATGADAAAQAAAAAAAAAGAKGADKGGAADPKLKADPLAWLPEKFRVKKDGTDELDIEASAKKGMGSLAELEKRMKDTGLPPESAEAYEFKPPAGMEALELDGALSAEAKKGMHALGLTQKQYQGVMEMYLKSVNDTVTRGVQMGAAKATEALVKVWGPADGDKFKGNLALAHRAFAAFADKDDMALIDTIGNSPVILRVLSKIGRELNEDSSTDSLILSSESVDALMKDPAYFNERHPRHAEVKAKVMRHFEAKAASEARRAAAG